MKTVALDRRTIPMLDELVKSGQLTRDDIELLMAVLKENEGSEFEVLQHLAGYTYREFPVDPETFFLDPYYLGLEGQIWPRILKDLIELFEGDYTEAVLTGAIGWGKGTFGEIAMCRMIYEVSCFRNPQQVYGLMDGSAIAFINVSVNEEQARRAVFHGIKMKVQNSPYFREKFPYNPFVTKELRFPNHIWVAPVPSVETGVIGYNVFGGVLDEVNFMPVIKGGKRSRGVGEKYDHAENLYLQLIRRMKSRFMKKGKLPGILIQISSSKYPDDFTERRIKEALAGDTSIFWRRYSQWDTRPESVYTGEKFLLGIPNDGFKRPEIMDKSEENRKHLEERGLEVVEIPVEYRKDFEKDPYAAIRDLLGRPSLALRPFIVRRDKVMDAVTRGEAMGLEHPFSKEYTTLLDGGRFLMEKFKWYRLLKEAEKKEAEAEKFGSPTKDRLLYEARLLRKEAEILKRKPRFAHIDLGVSGDAAGLAVVYIDSMRKVQRSQAEDATKTIQVEAPFIVVELMLQIRPPKDGEIDIAMVRGLILELKHYGVPIKVCSYDQFQSVESRQQLEHIGIKAPHVSCDGNPDVYETLKEAIYEDRLAMYSYPIVLKELAELEKNEQTGKVDHPPNGSKDVADALAGAVYNATVWEAQPMPVAPIRGTVEKSKLVIPILR